MGGSPAQDRYGTKLDRNTQAEGKTKAGEMVNAGLGDHYIVMERV